jgi:FKBP-type peptidyl-prolyl cis-trans isomerase 2
MTQAKQGDTVQVHFVGTLEDGTVFSTTRNGDPFEFTIGDGQVISAFEKGVEGMEIGETKDIKANPDEAFGPRREELVTDVEREALPDDVKPEVGQFWQVRQENGALVNVTVTDVKEEMVTIDANHPLAGKTLLFEVELLGLPSQES